MVTLQYTVPDPSEIRTCHVLETQPDGSQLKLFQFQTFSNNQTCETDFLRFNTATNRYEIAGEIKWDGQMKAQVTFGVVTFPLHEVRRIKKATSQSRRFRWDDSEYKWKRGGTDNKDYFCYDWLNRLMASYAEETKTLEVTDRGYAILDQIVMTCLLHRWIMSLGYW